MASKTSKKGRNSGAVDTWLDGLKLYRKNVAYDETCLFRAVSEQLFECQVFHERIRRECVEFGITHYDLFNHLIETEEEWLEHLKSLEKHMVICGILEIYLISKKYKRDVLIFYANKQEVRNITNYNPTAAPLMLCLMDDDHYDAVYEKEHIENAGFCQSLVYKILYEGVFQIPNVDNIVKAMLYEKSQIINPSEVDNNKVLTEKGEVNVEDINNAVIAPFPFKVAKALDPAIYRNIEYDSWGEVRREFRLGDWYNGDDKLKLGTKCILNDTQSRHDCYIQEILKNENKCVVYLTKTAEKRIVNYADLAPESDAKPWPLPYRFSKNLVIENSANLPPIEKIKMNRKKNKDRRQTKSFSEPNPAVTMGNGDDKISAFVGIPLQMQSQNTNNKITTTKVEVSTDTSELSVSQPELVLSPVTPDTSQYPEQGYQWEQTPEWHTQYTTSDNVYYPPTPESVVWPHIPIAQYYDCRSMVASAPVTPTVIPYHDTNSPFYFNIPVENYPYPLSPSIPTSQVVSSQEDIDRTRDSILSPQATTTTNETSATSSAVVQNVAPKPTITYLPQTPQQPVEMYQVIPIAPGTPMIYSTVPSQSTATNVEVMVPPSSVTMYTPTTPVEMQYVQQPNYIYSPGTNVPPIPVYTQANFPCNSQGFIFPQPK